MEPERLAGRAGTREGGRVNSWLSELVGPRELLFGHFGLLKLRNLRPSIALGALSVPKGNLRMS